MAFCTHCGTEISNTAKFCSGCGSPIAQNNLGATEENHRTYDGSIHKCPNCGESLKAFEMSCPTCRFELRGAKASNAVKDLATKLEQANSEKQRCIIIRNFPIPNTKEDIFEFMFLASSNFDAAYYATHLGEDDISDAWLAKVEQCYQKASLMFSHQPYFEQIQAIYRKIIADIELQKKTKSRTKEKAKNQITPKQKKTFAWIAGFLILFSVLFVSPYFTHTATENRLEDLVTEVEEHIQNGDLDLARNKANQIIYDGDWSSESEEKWNRIRESLLKTISQQEVLLGKKLYVGISHEDMREKNYADIVSYLEQQGFTYIKAEKIPDLVTGWLTSDGSVEKVTINGSSEFLADSTFEPNAEIIVFYHTFK